MNLNKIRSENLKIFFILSSSKKISEESGSVCWFYTHSRLSEKLQLERGRLRSVHDVAVFSILACKLEDRKM